jgi:lipopolysaccharide assembly protein A
MRIVAWLLRGIIFFTLFAFALNNQQPATVHWFFGFEWQAPMVIIVLAAVGAGAVLGVLAMLPNWWKARRAPAVVATLGTASATMASAASSATPSSGALASAAAERPSAVGNGPLPVTPSGPATAADRRVPPAHDGLGI